MSVASYAEDNIFFSAKETLLFIAILSLEHAMLVMSL